MESEENAENSSSQLRILELEQSHNEERNAKIGRLSSALNPRGDAIQNRLCTPNNLQLERGFAMTDYKIPTPATSSLNEDIQGLLELKITEEIEPNLDSELIENSPSKNEQSVELTESARTESIKPQAMAFTIDFNDGKSVDNQKYKNMLQKMQSRSKPSTPLKRLEEHESPGSTVSSASVKSRTSSSKLLNKKTAWYSDAEDIETDQMSRSTPDSMKRKQTKNMRASASFQDSPYPFYFDRGIRLRHSLGSKSLSPRTSWNENSLSRSVDENSLYSLPDSNVLKTAIPSSQSHQDFKSSAQISPFDKVVVQNSDEAEEEHNAFIIADHEGSDGSVSEAGTYTIENDNYTEEERARMNIDAMLALNMREIENVNCIECERSNVCEPNSVLEVNPNCGNELIKSDFIQYEELGSIYNNQQTPVETQYNNKAVKLMKTTNIDVEKRIELFEQNLLNEEIKQSSRVSSDRNVLEVSFCYEPNTIPKSKTHRSVLEKLKNRVKNISDKTFQKAKSPDHTLDLGSFTSVTTSGVLSKSDSSQYSKKLNHKNSLTTSQIDTSDYLQPGLINAKIEVGVIGGLSNTKSLNTSRQNHQISPSELSQKSTSPTHVKCLSQTPSNKSNTSFQNSWIYEWARSASEHNRKQLQDLETTKVYDANSDIVENNKFIKTVDKMESKQLNISVNCNNQQYMDQVVSDVSFPLIGGDHRHLVMDNAKLPPRHPSASPTKIPSPISTLARARSRSSYSLSGSISDLNSPSIDTESYLRNTEEAINTLQSMSSRRGSQQASHHSDSQNVSPHCSLDNSLSPKRSPQHTHYTQISPNSDTALSPKHTNMYVNKHSQLESATLPRYFEENQITSTFSRSRPKHTRHFSFDNQSHQIDLEKKSNIPSSQNINVFEHNNFKLKYDYDNKNQGLNSLLDLEKNDLRRHNRHHSFDVRNLRNEEFLNIENLNCMPPKLMSNKTQTKADHSVTHSKNIDQTLDLSRVAQQNNKLFALKDNTLNQNKNAFTKAEYSHRNPNKHIANSELVTSISNKLISKHQNSPTSSPIRRSSSFSANRTGLASDYNSKQRNANYGTPKMTTKQIERSTSNSNVKTFMGALMIRSNRNSDGSKNDYGSDNEPNYAYNEYEDEENDPEFHNYSSDSENECYEESSVDTKPKEAITNTRYNRAFSLRRARLELEKNEPPRLQKSASSSKVNQYRPINKTVDKVIKKTTICTSSPESAKPSNVRSSFRDRASMPRDSSLCRMKQNLDASFDVKESQTNAKKAGNIQPRYMDISKYKSPTTSTFLRKDESKSYLDTKSAGTFKGKNQQGIARNESTRLSLRSNKPSNGYANKNPVRKDIAVKNQTKEQELANWKRRATYDPMKAAAEGRRKAELAKKMVSNSMTQSYNEDDNMLSANSSNMSSVLRSQSFHGTAAMERYSDWTKPYSTSQVSYRGRPMSPDSSDEEFEET